MKLGEIGEFGLIEQIKDLVNSPSENLIMSIADDAAAFKVGKEQIYLLTTDAFIEGVHFNLSYFTFYELGWRILSANFSDIAAMAGWPKFALVTLGLPADVEVKAVEELYRGMKTLADEYKTAIVGGDTTRSPDRIFLALTVIGQIAKNKLTPRSGAEMGDSIFVTGNLGGANAGLRALSSQDVGLKEKFVLSVAKHLMPAPRLREAAFLVDNFTVHAMIDISDGLASDLHHICKLSDVGALVYERRIPIAQETQSVAENFKENSLDYALYGGEDFELLFTVPKEIEGDISSKFLKRFGLNCTKIGHITQKSKGIVLQRLNGEQLVLPQKGFDHFSKS
ncbi:MAG: thiamine-phosphate kinase [bacterium]